MTPILNAGDKNVENILLKRRKKVNLWDITHEPRVHTHHGPVQTNAAILNGTLTFTVTRRGSKVSIVMQNACPLCLNILTEALTPP